MRLRAKRRRDRIVEALLPVEAADGKTVKPQGVRLRLSQNARGTGNDNCQTAQRRGGRHDPRREGRVRRYQSDSEIRLRQQFLARARQRSGVIAARMGAGQGGDGCAERHRSGGQGDDLHSRLDGQWLRLLHPFAHGGGARQRHDRGAARGTGGNSRTCGPDQSSGHGHADSRSIRNSTSRHEGYSENS